MDVFLLSRIQFALTIMFHYLFPPLTIGMGIVLVYLMGMHLKTREPIYESAARFWTGIFGLNFALGVATGITMEFQFGTNWAVYSRYVGDVFGSALAAEGIFAFFLESGFLAVLIFGWDRVSPKMHFFAALMVALGSIFSAIWIVVANSWQQTPAGYHLVQMVRDGQPWVYNGEPVLRAEITSFWAVVFGPSSMIRLAHTLVGAFVMGGFFIMSISAWYLLKNKHLEFAKRSFTGALVLATVAAVGQLALGHVHAQVVAVYQPAKLAAFEGQFATTRQAGLHLFGWPDEAQQRVKYGLAMPGMLSWLAFGDRNAEVKGLNELAPKLGTPPVWLAFQTFHIMVGLGFLFIATTLYASYRRWRGTLWEARWLLWYFVFAVGLAVAANQLGWVAAEVGRQPWIVHPALKDGAFVDGLKTSKALSEVVRAESVAASIVMFLVMYGLLGAVWVFVLNHKIQAGPKPVHAPGTTTATGLMRAASERVDHDDSMTDAKEEGEKRGE